MQAARGLLAAGGVLRSDWRPPTLTGMVREGTTTYRAGLVIRSVSDADNLCSCRASRQRGLICSHSVAAGLHHLQQTSTPAGAGNKDPTPKTSKAPASKPAPRMPARALRRASAGEAGEPLELHLILPPNFAEAAARSRAMLCWEGTWRRGRSPLNGLPVDMPFVLEPQDAALLDAIEALSGGDTPGMLILATDTLTGLLPLLVDHPRVTIGKTKTIRVSGVPWRFPLRATLESNGDITLDAAGQIPPGVLAGATPWIIRDQTLQPIDLPNAVNDLLRGPMRIPRSAVPGFLTSVWPALVRGAEPQSNFAPADFVLEPVAPRFRLHLVGGLARLEARLECRYGRQQVQPGVVSASDAVWLPDPQSPTRYLTRHLEAEQAAVGRLLRRGFTGPDNAGGYRLEGQDAVLEFFARDYPELERQWEVTLEESLERSAQRNLDRIEPQFRVTPSGEQWFDLEVTYRSKGGERFSAADIQRLLLSGRGHARTRKGRIVLLDTGAVEELHEVLRDCQPQQHAEKFRLHQSHAGFVDATLRQSPGWRVDTPAAWARRAAQHQGECVPLPPPLGSLEPILRPYQKTGVAWLQFLRDNGFGGILADEMGLGKTLQVLALLQSLRDNGALTGPAMVVCPTSLVFNWAAEAARFTPDLRVLVLHGPRRQDQLSTCPKHDLVITSYALLRRDAANYQGMEFEMVVLDEAQHIKNRQTQNAQSVKTIPARHRLVLTGTPLENSVLDLWSIFDFLMPGYLGSANEFRERYEIPVARDGDPATRNRLARRLRPFVLRRRKQDVAADLPDKIEQVLLCELNEEQHATYQQVLEASRREIVQAVDNNGLARSRMLILTALLRLRQVCCDLRLLETQTLDPERAREPTPSGKVELFNELLEEVLDGGHRVLVFSQFTRMLGLLRNQLVSQQIDFCYLDGATRDRAAVVRRFQESEAIPVFLISLKAGGIGLNLTGADTVIHFDPWWNPAVEAQATDRAHRIGQERVVTSYKLITRGTVEEKILRLQSRKRTLIEDTLGSEEQLAQALSWEDVQGLLAG